MKSVAKKTVTKRAVKKAAPKRASKSGSKRASKSGSKRASKRVSKIKLGASEAYCVTCRGKCKVIDGKYSMKKSATRVTYLLKGKCQDGHNVAKIVSKDTYTANK